LELQFGEFSRSPSSPCTSLPGVAMLFAQLKPKSGCLVKCSKRAPYCHSHTDACREATRARFASDNTLGVTHGALARACHAAYERGSSGWAWNLLRRPVGRLRRFVNRGDVICHQIHSSRESHDSMDFRFGFPPKSLLTLSGQPYGVRHLSNPSEP
jgi:hypothetical protein